MYTGSWHPVLRGCGREFFGTQFPHRKIKLRNELRITAKCLGSGWLATVTVKYSIVSCYPLAVTKSSRWGLRGGSVVKNLPAMQETQIRSLGQEDPIGKGMVTQSSIIAWIIPWTEEPGGL